MIIIKVRVPRVWGDNLQGFARFIGAKLRGGGMTIESIEVQQ